MASKLITSGRNTPCPICSRDTDGDCRWNDDVIFCHNGSSFAPPQDLRIGDITTIAGRPWALVKTNAGYDGAAHVFKPHRERETPSAAPQPKATDIDHKARSAVAKFMLDRFLDKFAECWDLDDFHTLTIDQLRKAFELVYQTDRDGIALATQLQSFWRDFPELRDVYKDKVEACMKSLRYQRRDVDHFRNHYLGEVI